MSPLIGYDAIDTFGGQLRVLFLPAFNGSHQHFLFVGALVANFLCEGTIEGFAGFHPSGLVAHQTGPSFLFGIIGRAAVVETAVEKHGIPRFGEYPLFFGKARMALGWSKGYAIAPGNDDDGAVILAQCVEIIPAIYLTGHRAVGCAVGIDGPGYVAMPVLVFLAGLGNAGCSTVELDAGAQDCLHASEDGRVV